MADMMNKFTLFLAVDGFNANEFQKLWQCFGDLHASTRMASFIADEEIRSKEGIVNTHSDLSFAEASEQRFDVLVIADGVTANAIKDDLPAKTALIQASERNVPVVTVGEGALALVAADVVSGLEVAAPSNLREQLEKAGARLSDKPIAASNYVFSARTDADIRELCNAVSEFVTTKREKAA